eukprot:3989674-Pleurochrysis_carterae.AAC.3
MAGNGVGEEISQMDAEEWASEAARPASDLLQVVPADGSQTGRAPLASEPQEPDSAPPLRLALPAHLAIKKPFNICKWLAREAARIQVEQGLSLRGAAASRQLTLRPCPHCALRVDPDAGGRTAYLHDNFCEDLIRWIKAVRGLKYPLFAGQVIATANRSLQGTSYLAKFKHGLVDKYWYYAFLKRHLMALGTASQKLIEMDRERWATSRNIKAWYDVLGKTLVEAGAACVNPDFDEQAGLGDKNAKIFIITEPGRIMSFDESRVELDTTESTKCKQQRIIVDNTAPAMQRLDSLAHKGGLAGTGVGGSTARSAACALHSSVDAPGRQVDGAVAPLGLFGRGG